MALYYGYFGRLFALIEDPLRCAFVFARTSYMFSNSCAIQHQMDKLLQLAPPDGTFQAVRGQFRTVRHVAGFSLHVELR